MILYSNLSAELTKYRKRRIHETKNLLTGEAEIAPGSIPLPEGGAPVTTEIISYYHPNLTINLVDDQLLWTKGSVPQPLDKREPRWEFRRCTETYCPSPRFPSPPLPSPSLSPTCMQTLYLMKRLETISQCSTSTTTGTWRRTTCPSMIPPRETGTSVVTTTCTLEPLSFQPLIAG